MAARPAVAPVDAGGYSLGMTANDPVPTSFPAPVGEGERINSVDVIRGVAVLGILLMNIVGMGMPDPAYWDPSGWGGDTGWNLGVWWANSVLFEGTMRALFSMLFGAGVLLFTGKGDQKDAGLSVADAWYRRTIWLFLFGIVHAYFLLWPGEILYAYGLMGMFLFPFRNVAPGRLFALGAALLLAFSARVRPMEAARNPRRKRRPQRRPLPRPG